MGQLSSDERRLFIRMAEVFAGYVSYSDDQLGRVLDFLESAGELDNTIIVAVSDNGASGEGGPSGTFNEWRFFNGLPTPAELSLEHIDELGGPTSYNHYNTGWAWAFDTPFLYWKRWAGYEGGVAGMCLVAWPAGIDARGEVRQQYVHAVDVVPTLYDLLGVEPPEVLKGYPQNPIEFAATSRNADPAMPGAAGRLTLYMDDQEIGSYDIVTQPGYFCVVGDGICVGRDDASPVTPGYEGPFPFAGGTIDKVVVDVSGERYVDHEAQVRGWFMID
ncbi:sulfatase-like hydrolase/transferase [Streptomyces sp. NRRL WC-3618]|uniref:sulfatase-like hydrolase/transferase n=1 Tax=Streptomyces sp. NRRL WC-3618 TaxID=1519490 RepID=UPI002D219462|nr:sulfatase-like hydrolase/transferase [Streptomyces sp. NRRL WC-3618]